MYQKVAIISKIKEESFFSNFKVLAEEGYLKVAGVPQGKRSVNKGKSRTDANEKRKMQNRRQIRTLIRRCLK